MQIEPSGNVIGAAIKGIDLAQPLSEAVREAALAWGAQAHAFELDSLVQPSVGVHPGATVALPALAMAQAQLVLFVVDTQDGLTGADQEIASLLRRKGIKTVLVTGRSRSRGSLAVWCASIATSASGTG